MTDRIPTMEELINWSNSVAERKMDGEHIDENEYKAAKAVFEYCLQEQAKLQPMQIYAMLMRHHLKNLKDE